MEDKFRADIIQCKEQDKRKKGCYTCERVKLLDIKYESYLRTFANTFFCFADKGLFHYHNLLFEGSISAHISSLLDPIHHSLSLDFIERCATTDDGTLV